MLKLPDPPTRALLRSFGLVWTAPLAVAAGAVVGRGSVALGTAAGGFLGLLWALLAWSRPETVEPLYRAWSGMARFVARGARLWLTGLCFLIVAVVGRAGSALRWRSAAATESGWRPKATMTPEAYPSLSQLASRASAGQQGVRPLLSWGWRTGNVWVWALVPFLVLLGAVQGGGRGSLGGDVYTLY